MKTPSCRLCGASVKRLFRAPVLKTHSVEYFQCQRCLLVQTEEPYWLNEAYRQPIGDLDTWQIERSLYSAVLVESVLPLLNQSQGRVVDFGAGYGMLVRLLRNRGIEAYWFDQFTDNLFAKEYCWDGGCADLVSCFEVVEHFLNPREEFERILSIGDAVLFSTLLISNPPPSPNQWDYYAFEGGQHIALYSIDTLRYLAKQFSLHLYSNGVNLHLLTKRPIDTSNISTLPAWQHLVRRIEQTFAPSIGQPSLRVIDTSAVTHARKPTIGIAIFHGLGDILNATIIARQIKHDHPNAHLVWFTAEQYAFVLQNNPDIDEIVAMPGKPTQLDAQFNHLHSARQWDAFYVPAPYTAYDKFPGGDLTELLLATYDGTITVPLRPVMQLSETEVEHARTWWATLPSNRPRILVETEFFSAQSPWDITYARAMIESLRALEPVFVFTAKNRPPYLDELAQDYPDIVWCDLPFRLNAELYNCCDAFIGVSSAISCLANSTWCRADVPHIEVVNGPHWSTWHFRHHTRRRIVFDRVQFQAALNWLAEVLTGKQSGEIQTHQESLLNLYTHRIEGKYHWLSPTLLPNTNTAISQQDALRTITRTLSEIEPFYFCYGGIGDFLLALSSALDKNEPITVVCYPNSTAAAQAFFDTLPAVTKVYIIQRYREPQFQYIAGMYLRAATMNLPNCRGRGVTPPGREDDFWQPGLDVVQTCGVTLYPRWIEQYRTERLEHPQVVLAPMGSVYGMFRSKRNILPPQFWNSLLSILRATGIRPIIIGTPDEANAYPSDGWAHDKRSYSFDEQFRILASADVVIAADSWHKTFAAMAQVPTIVFDTLRNFDLTFWRDSSQVVFIQPWNNIRLVRTWQELIGAIASVLKSKGIDLVTDTTPPPRQPDYLRRTNPKQPLTSLHPVFWERTYQEARSVLLRIPDAVGDTLMMTAVANAIGRAHPHLEIIVAGPHLAADIFRDHPNVHRCVITNSAEDLRAEANADIIVDYRWLIDLLPEYYGILPMMDILANIAGVRLPSKQLVYSVTSDEHQWASEQLRDAENIVAVHLNSIKDHYRSYPHAQELLTTLLTRLSDSIVLWLGSEPAPIHSKRIIDCARNGYTLRQQIALVERATSAIVIDSAFYHVAHNLFRKPTLLLAGPTNEYLIGDYTAAPLYTLRHSQCSSCYWQAQQCKRVCLSLLSPQIIAAAAAQLLERVRAGTALPLPAPNPPTLQCTWDRLQMNYFATCVQHYKCGGGLVRLVITPSDPLPPYADQWNGITIAEQTTTGHIVSLSEIFQP